MDFKKIYREASSEKEKLIEEAYSIINPFIDKIGDLSQFHYDDIIECYDVMENKFYDIFGLSEKEQRLILKWHKQMYEREPHFWKIGVEDNFNFWVKRPHCLAKMLIVCFIIYTMKNDNSKAKEIADLFEKLDSNGVICPSKEAFEWIHNKANKEYICPDPFY